MMKAATNHASGVIALPRRGGIVGALAGIWISAGLVGLLFRAARQRHLVMEWRRR